MALCNHRQNIHEQVLIIQIYIVHLIISERKRKLNPLQSQYIVAGKIEYNFNNDKRIAAKFILDVSKEGRSFHKCCTVF